jgi:SIR2-like domain
MSANTVREQVSLHLSKVFRSKEFEPFVNKQRKVLPIVGNGLSRLTFGVETSWDSWIRRALCIAGKRSELFDSLKRRGFDHPEILHHALKAAASLGADDQRIRKIWSWFAKRLYAMETSHIHRALALMADSQIATTNYDVLLELAASDVGRYSPNHVMKPHNGNDEMLPAQYPPKDDKLIISKLHGSLPSPDIKGRLKVDRLREWINAKSYNHLITTSAVYRSATLGAGAALRLLPFFEFQTALEREDNLCLLVGTSLSSAELVLLRMLYNRWGNRRNLVIFHISHPGDPQIRFDELGIAEVSIPLGLAAHPWRRRLAHIAFLELLLDRVFIPEPRKKLAHDYLKKAYDELEGSLGPDLKPTFLPQLKKLEPVVGCVGSLQTTRVIGLKNPAEQERSFKPEKATVAPRARLKETLISDASLGQGGNPIIVWDALGIPSAIVAEVGDDVAGDFIVSRLSDLKWTNFDGVIKVLPREKQTECSPGCATESFTAFTWFGARTILDSRRFRQGRERAKLNHAMESIQKLPILYMTKSYSHAFMRQCGGLRPIPLIVLETGTDGDPATEEWVARRGGVIVGSALTALRWIKGRKTKIPANEHGRYIQLAHLLKVLPDTQQKPGNPRFIQESGLNAARAIVVTLGELGSLAWIRKKSRWSKALWTYPRSLRTNAAKQFSIGTTLPLSEIRDALGCGDCARAGFTASLARSLKFGMLKGDLPRASFGMAIASLNWFGIQKIRYFGMDRYAKFLQGVSPGFWRAWQAAAKNLSSIRRAGGSVRLGGESFEVYDTGDAVEEITTTGGLLNAWLKRFDPGTNEKRSSHDKKNRERIRILQTRWKDARGFSGA